MNFIDDNRVNFLNSGRIGYVIHPDFHYYKIQKNNKKIMKIY